MESMCVGQGGGRPARGSSVRGRACAHLCGGAPPPPLGPPAPSGITVNPWRGWEALSSGCPLQRRASAPGWEVPGAVRVTWGQGEMDGGLPRCKPPPPMPPPHLCVCLCGAPLQQAAQQSQVRQPLAPRGAQFLRHTRGRGQMGARAAALPWGPGGSRRSVSPKPGSGGLYPLPLISMIPVRETLRREEKGLGEGGQGPQRGRETCRACPLPPQPSLSLGGSGAPPWEIPCFPGEIEFKRLFSQPEPQCPAGQRQGHPQPGGRLRALGVS